MTSLAAAATAASFREAMSRHASGVAVVTHDVDGRPWGTTVTSFASVSDAPPTVLVSLRADTTSASAITDGRRFAVSLLGRDQEDVARHCAAPGGLKFIDRFPRIDVRALAHLECVLVDTIEAGDHVLFLGRVLSAHTGREAPPLLYHRREYRDAA